MIRLIFVLARYALLLAGLLWGGIRIFHGGFWIGLAILGVTLLATAAVAAAESWSEKRRRGTG